MKRFIFSIFLLLALSSVFAQQAEFSPWSFTAEYGISGPDRDGDSSIQPSVGASVEYAVFPFAGLSVDYYHFRLAGSAFRTDMNTGDVNVTVNFSKLLLSHFDNKVTLNGSVGVGLAGYTTNYQTSTASVVKGYELATCFPVVALSVEYYLIKNLALGAKAQFRPFNKDNLEGDPLFNYSAVSNDNILAVTVYLRLKLYAAN